MILLVWLSSCTETDFSSAGADSQRSQTLKRLADIGITDSSSLQRTCQSAAPDLLSLQVNLSFPPRQTCSFGQPPNLAPQEARVQAREISPATITLPSGAVICEMTINSSPGSLLRYDDFLFLTIENQVVFASNRDLTDRLNQNQGLFQWDFNRIVGGAIANFESGVYCLGQRSQCQIPGHDTQGPVNINLSPAELAPLAFAVAGTNNLATNLVATGDNDPSDCMHTQLDLLVNVRYLQSQ